MFRRRSHPATRPREDRLEFRTDPPPQAAPQSSRILVGRIDRRFEAERSSQISQGRPWQIEERPSQDDPVVEATLAVDPSPSAWPRPTGKRRDHGLELVLCVVSGHHRRRPRLAGDLEERLLASPSRDGRPIARTRAVDLTNQAREVGHLGVTLHQLRFIASLATQSVIQVCHHKTMG